MKEYQKRYATGTMTIEEVTGSIRSYNGHLQHENTWNLYSEMVFTRGMKEDVYEIQNNEKV